MQPKVSIVIPARDEEAYLPACLQALRELDYPKELIEIIVVDNGSRDRTREIAAQFGATVLEGPDETVAGLRNLGAAQASGEILAFVDADCVVASDWLVRASVYFDDRDVVAWGSPPLAPRDGTWVQQTWELVRLRPQQTEEADWLESMNLFVRKEDFIAIGGFTERLVTCEDVDFCYRIASRGKVMADRRMRVFHNGEARTLREFVVKEVWRGQSNLTGLRTHGFRRQELPSLLLPVYFAILLPLALLAALLTREASWLLLGLLLYALPSALALCKVVRKPAAQSWRKLLKLSLLLQVYFFARTVAVFKRA